jgi:acetylornithine deacetylase/succinyl-diaminopimelate desuccinylase-like protein
MSPTRTAPTIRCRSWRGSSPRSTRSISTTARRLPAVEPRIHRVSTHPARATSSPARATAQLNIRFNNLQRGADLVELVEEIAEREAPGATVKRAISGEAFLTPPGPLYDVVVSAIEETGIEPELSTSGGTSDGRFLIQLCPVVDFGLPNATMHKVGEARVS